MQRRSFLAIFFLTIAILASNCQRHTLPYKNAIETPIPARRTSIPKSEIPTTSPFVLWDGTPFNIPWEDRSFYTKWLNPSLKNILDGLPGASVYHLAFSISDSLTSIVGLEEVRYTNQENVILTEIDFAIFPEILGGTIKISNVTLNGAPVIPIFRQGLMRLPLISPLSPNQFVIIGMEFSITVPAQGGDFYYGIFGFNQGMLSLAHAYPTILVYNERGWNNQTPDLQGDPLFSDIAFYLVSIDAPADLTFVGSGIELDRHKKGSHQQVLYAGGPARDFYLAASKDYEIYSETDNGLIIDLYAPANMKQTAQLILRTAKAAIDDFNQRYSSYPYTEFKIVSIATSAGGVEFPGVIAIAERLYGQDDYLEAVVAHEVAHQWFYNIIGNDTQQQPWLDESLAQFVTWQYFDDRYGSQAAQSFLEAIKARWDILTDKNIPIGAPVSNYTSDQYTAIVYGRGLFFFMELRKQIGQANFDSLMLDYAVSYSWDIATTEDFKNLAEKHCMCDLSPLFQEWVYP